MSNNLAPFEKRIENWEVIHPRRWIATTDRAKVADFLSAQTRKITEGQLKAADRVIVSQGRIADKIDDAILATRDIAEGLEELQATFEWGITELIWQIEQEREVLKNILKVLQAPLDTQAKELKKRAEYAYRNRWIDDAFQDFLESEKKNRYDFTIHQNLGNIYFFEKKNPEKALEYYNKAVKYATPKSSYYTSISLLHVGLVKYLQEDFQGAYEATSKAIELSPNLYEAHYQHAQYCVKLGKYDEAIKHLKKAIVEGDKYYWVKADSEKDFNVIKKQLHSLFKELHNNAESQVFFGMGAIGRLIDRAKSHYNIPEIGKLKIARTKLLKSTVLLWKRSFLDCHDAYRKIFVAAKITVDFSVEYLSNQTKMLEDKIITLKKEVKRRESSGINDFLAWFGAIPFLISTITIIGMSSLSAGSKAWLILLMFLLSPAVYFIIKSRFSILYSRGYSLQIPPLEAKKNELNDKLLEARTEQSALYRNLEYEELKNEKSPEKLEALLQNRYMSILGVMHIKSVRKKNGKMTAVLDFREMEECLRLKRRKA